MLKQIRIANYKSVEALTLDLGRVNVFIGENGAGKSNVLEAIALAGAADAGKLDNEFLASRGIRVTEPRFMRSAFDSRSSDQPIKVTMLADGGISLTYNLLNDGKPYSPWHSRTRLDGDDGEQFAKDFARALIESIDSLKPADRIEKVKEWVRTIESAHANPDGSGHVRINPTLLSPTLSLDDQRVFPRAGNALDGFVIYSPENSALRLFEREGQIEPLGINGEGLLKLLTVMADNEAEAFARIKTALAMLNWFEDFALVHDGSRTRMEIVDRFLDPASGRFDQRSANEGFLFVTFFFTLFASALTPRFFAIDNIDASLNPRLCQALIEQLVRLAKDGNKQVILTTHQPAILDGLNLNDDEQRLFIVSRASNGKTRVRRYEKPLPADHPRRLSSLFLGGEIGGLPKSF